MEKSKLRTSKLHISTVPSHIKEQAEYISKYYKWTSLSSFVIQLMTDEIDQFQKLWHLEDFPKPPKHLENYID